MSSGLQSAHWYIGLLGLGPCIYLRPIERRAYLAAHRLTPFLPNLKYMNANGLKHHTSDLRRLVMKMMTWCIMQP